MTPQPDVTGSSDVLVRRSLRPDQGDHVAGTAASAPASPAPTRYAARGRAITPRSPSGRGLWMIAGTSPWAATLAPPPRPVSSRCCPALRRRRRSGLLECLIAAVLRVDRLRRPLRRASPALFALALGIECRPRCAALNAAIDGCAAVIVLAPAGVGELALARS